jgi:hypothetical protein
MTRMKNSIRDHRGDLRQLKRTSVLAFGYPRAATRHPDGLCLPGICWRLEFAGGYVSLDEPGGDLSDPPVGVLGVAAEQVEGLGGRDPEFSVQNALRLLDYGPGFERCVQAFDHPAAGPVQGGVVHGGAALRRDEQRDVMRGTAEHVRLLPVERDRGRNPGLLRQVFSSAALRPASWAGRTRTATRPGRRPGSAPSPAAPCASATASAWRCRCGRFRCRTARSRPPRWRSRLLAAATAKPRRALYADGPEEPTSVQRKRFLHTEASRPGCRHHVAGGQTPADERRSEVGASPSRKGGRLLGGGRERGCMVRVSRGSGSDVGE